MDFRIMPVYLVQRPDAPTGQTLMWKAIRNEVKMGADCIRVGAIRNAGLSAAM